MDVQRTCLLIDVSSGAQKITGSGFMDVQRTCLFNRCLLWSPINYWFRVYGCPEDMPINRCLLRSTKYYWLRVYGCPEDMPIDSRLTNKLDLTEHY
jgi:hypothetical protein